MTVNHEDFLTGLSVIKKITKNLPCSDMRVLRSLFKYLGENMRGPVSQWCMEMMDKRRLAGHPIEKRHVWWRENEWQKQASLVLVIQMGKSELKSGP